MKRVAVLRVNTLRAYCGLVGLLAVAAGCSSTPRAPQPIEYLNGETGVTVTTVEQPLVFMRRVGDSVKNQHASVTLAAASVNHGGKRDYLLCVYVWSTMDLHDELSTEGPIPLVLVVDERRIEFTNIGKTPADFGIAHPAGAPPWAPQRQWASPTDLATLRSIAAARSLKVESSQGGTDVGYALFKDGRPALDRFVRYLDGNP